MMSAKSLDFKNVEGVILVNKRFSDKFLGLKKIYIKDGLIFPEKRVNLEFIKGVRTKSFDFKSKKVLIKNRLLFNELDEGFFVKKSVEVSDYSIFNSERAKFLTELLKDNKVKLSVVDQSCDDFSDFIELTSSREIVKNIIEQLEIVESEFESIIEKIECYIKENRDKEAEFFEGLQNRIELLESELSKFRNERSDLNKKIKFNEKRIKKKKDDIRKLIQKIEKIESSLKSSFSGDVLEDFKLNRFKINEEISKVKSLIEREKNNIKILKVDRKIGKSVVISPLYIFLFIVSFGLIYWSKYFKIDYIILKKERKIYELNNELIQLKSELKSVSSRIENLKKGDLDSSKIVSQNDVEKREKLISKKESLEIKVNQVKGLIKDFEDELVMLRKRVSKIESKIDSVSKELTEKVSELEQYQKFSLGKISKRLNFLKKEFENHKKKVQDIYYFEISDV